MPQITSGPERIEAGWWDQGEVRRDYYIVRTSTGADLWVFRDLKTQAWYLHGFDEVGWQTIDETKPLPAGFDAYVVSAYHPMPEIPELNPVETVASPTRHRGNRPLAAP